MRKMLQLILRSHVNNDFHTNLANLNELKLHVKRKFNTKNKDSSKMILSGKQTKSPYANFHDRKISQFSSTITAC